MSLAAGVVSKAQAHMTKMAFMFEDKNLEAQSDKTCYIMMKDSKNDVKKLEELLNLNHVKFTQFMKSWKIEDKQGREIQRHHIQDQCGIEGYFLQSMEGKMAAKFLLERSVSAVTFVRVL